MSLPTAQVTLSLDVTLDSVVKVPVDPPPGLGPDDLDDWLEENGDQVRIVTLGELVAETLITQASPALPVAIRARLEAITDEELRAYARETVIGAVMGTDRPGGLTIEQLTVAARIEREIRRQLNDPAATYAHGREAPVVDAIVQTTVTNAFRDMTADVVAEVRSRVLAEIGHHARSAEEPIPPGG